MAKVTLKNVFKYYDKNVPAVDDFSMDINDREFIVLVGPSGCGKSTTLRMIAGLEEISKGELYIDDKLVNDIPPKNRDIAMVFQNYALYPHMTVFENMAFGLKLRKTPKTEIQKRVHDAAKILELTDLLDRKPKALSGGQQQRVAVGRAIVRNPKVFLFDEPLSNLDAKLRVQMRTEISRLHNTLQSTMIYVTHDQMEAMTMGDRIVVMKDGLVQQVDSPLNLYNAPKNKFVAGFIGSPAMNLLDATVVQNGALWLSDGKIKIKLPQRLEKKLSNFIGKKIIFGIRPEDIDEKEKAAKQPQTAIVSLAAEVIEPMGNESFLYANTGANKIIARLSPDLNLQNGEEIELAFNMGKAHFFNAENEEVIN